MATQTRRAFFKRSAVLAGTLLAAADAFAQIPSYAGAHSVPDWEKAGILEQKHSPWITAPDSVNAGEPFQVTVRVGRAEHPQQSDHHIEYIHLKMGDLMLAATSLHYDLVRPEATLTVKLDETAELAAFADCNLHGLWTERKVVKVVKAESTPAER